MIKDSVWIVEDNKHYRTATMRGLSALHPEWILGAFSNCEDALVALKNGDCPRVVLMDLGLPGMNGIQGIAEIKTKLPDSSILVLTVFDDDEKIFTAIQSGATGYLLKSDSITKIGESIELALSGVSPLHPRIAARVLKMFAEMKPAKRDFGLNDRERSVLNAMAQGLVRKQVAVSLGLNMHTLDYVTRCIYRKLHVNGATAAVALAVRERILEEPTRNE